MRTALGLLLGTLVLSGCFIEEKKETEPEPEPEDHCQGVPVEGECVDEKTIRGCLVSEEFDQAPEIITSTCNEYQTCQVGPNGAACVLVGECYPGESQCADASTLQECVDGSWVDSPCSNSSCLSQPGLGAQCLSNDGGSGITITGILEFEYLRMNSARTDFDSTPQRERGVDFFYTVYDLTDNELLGMGLTGAGVGGLDPGVFTGELSRQPDEDTYIYFWPMLFNNQGLPRMAMVHAQSSDAIHQQSDQYWWWGFEVCPAGGNNCANATVDVGTMLIDQASGSGAANVYRWMDYGLFSFEELFPGVDNLTFAVFWEGIESPIQFNCGNCFVPPIGGGAEITYDAAEGLKDHYDTSINISGTPESPTHWAKSVINHEFGHWTMQSYTKSPGEGGPHYVDAPSLPGLSYSEGYATFTGQRNQSNGPDDNDSIYFTKKNGTTFWVDVAKNQWSGGAIELPNPNGPLDQDINENVVTSMFWSLWASTNAAAPQGLGDTPVYQTIRSQRLLNNDAYNRGYHKVDFVDYLDAAKCGGTASDAQISAVTEAVDYPYGGTATCP